MIGNPKGLSDGKQRWKHLSLAMIAVSLLSTLLPILTYRLPPTDAFPGGHYFNIFGLMSRSFAEIVFAGYTGTFLYGVEYETIMRLAILLCIVGVAAIVMALVGIQSMSKQYESEWPFRLALCGLIGTAIPSLTLLVLYLFSFRSFPGTMHLGPYVFVTPLAMALAIRTVTARHRLTREEARAQAEAVSYIRPAGDLPRTIRRRGDRYGR